MSRLADYLQLFRWKVLILVGASVAGGFLIGSPGPFSMSAGFFLAVWGGIFAAAGAAAVNQVMERDADALMPRTANRPLPAGRMSRVHAVAAGAVMTGGGLLLLALVHPLASAVCAASALLYLGVYTPLKRRSSFNTLVGAVPGALPPVIGWAAAAGALPPAAWTLFAIFFLWQLPHFMAIAWIYRDQYARAGFKMLPLMDANGGLTARQAVAYAAALLPVSLLPAVWGTGTPVYFYGALALGAGFMCFTVWFWARRTEDVARRLVRVSVLYLPFLLGLLVQDKLLS